jgi:hypothetical protein
MRGILKNKTAAMEMSVGTIVTLVLLMTALILGLIMTRTIFKSSTENINSIDQSVKAEINKLFAEDDSKKVIVYPESRKITLKKGDDGLGFGFSIRNTGEEQLDYTYTINAKEASCKIDLEKADSYISLGASGEGSLAPGSIMENPIFVRFKISDTAPPCQIRYTIMIKNSDGTIYGSNVDVDVEIKSS